MRHALQRHPDFPCQAVSSIEVEVERPAPGQLLLRYRVSGVTDALVMPSPFPPGRTDGMWKHTCFEAFVQAPPDAGYRELNVAAGAWAAYGFDGYRQGMADAAIGPPDIHQSGPDGGAFDLLIGWELDLPQGGAWQVGVSVVVEETGGRLSYWALSHPPGRPDFHNADCFTLQLPAPEGP